jgi:hypothetical protein
MTIRVLYKQVLDHGFLNIAAMHIFTHLSSALVQTLPSLLTDMHYTRDACQHVGDPCTDTPAGAAAIVGSAARRTARWSPRTLYSGSRPSHRHCWLSVCLSVTFINVGETVGTRP